MFDAAFHEALAVLEPLAPAGAGADSACRSDALAALRLVRGGLDALEAGLLAGLDTSTAVEVLTAGGTSARQARKVAARAETLAAAPELSAGLATGTITGEHVDIVATVAGGLQPAARQALLSLGDDLVADGRRTAPESFSREVRRLGDLLAGDDGLARFERQRRATRLRRGVDPNTGMHWLHGEFDPETGGRLFSALDKVVERVFHRPDAAAATAIVAELVDDQEHLAAHALAHLCSRATGDGPVPAGSTSGAELLVLIDLQTLRHELRPGSVCETSSGIPLPPATVRRLACEAAIIPIVMGGDSLPLDHGRARRLATRAQRRALRAAHRTCVVPGCTVAFDWCQIHHLRDWLVGGVTDLADLAPLCHRHHHMVHEGAWTLTLDRQRRATFLPPIARAHAPPAVAAG